MRTLYGLEVDQSGKDVSRLCFLSVDPEMHYATDAVILPAQVNEKPILKESKNEGRVCRIGYNETPDARDRSASILRDRVGNLGMEIGEKLIVPVQKQIKRSVGNFME